MIMTLAAFLVALASAIEGPYTYEGAFQIISHSRVETVTTSTLEGRSRFMELKNLGYSCSENSEFSSCKKMFNAPGVVPNTLNNPKPSVQTVMFAPLIAMNLISQGDETAVYSAQQDVYVNGQLFPYVQYLERPDRIEITVCDLHELDNSYSLNVNSNSVTVIDTFVIAEPKSIQNIYHVEFTLTP